MTRDEDIQKDKNHPDQDTNTSWMQNLKKNIDMTLGKH